MRAAPAVQFTLPPQREFQFCIGIFFACAIAVAGHWLDILLGGNSGRLSIFAAAASFIGVMRHTRREAVCVRWDGQRWGLQRAPASSGNGDTLSGEFTAVIDLGPVMVMRFVELDLGKGLWRRKQWLIVRRRSMKPQWQVFRRAVYSPRPLVACPEASSIEKVAF